MASYNYGRSQTHTINGGSFCYKMGNLLFWASLMPIHHIVQEPCNHWRCLLYTEVLLYTMVCLATAIWSMGLKIHFAQVTATLVLVLSGQQMLLLRSIKEQNFFTVKPPLCLQNLIIRKSWWIRIEGHQEPGPQKVCQDSEASSFRAAVKGLVHLLFGVSMPHVETLLYPFCMAGHCDDKLPF